MVSVLDKNKRKGNQTVAQVLEDQEQQALKQTMSPAVTNGKANVEATQRTEDSEANRVLSHAVEIGETLSKHSEYVDGMRHTIEAGEWNDYKAIATLQWLEQYLTDEQLIWLPLPGSTKAEAVAARPKDSNEPLSWDVFTKTRPQTTFYKQLVASTPPGKEASDTLEKMKLDAAKAELHSESADYTADQRETHTKRANKRIDRQLVALKQAARIRIQIEKFKRASKLRLEWAREEYKGAEKTPVGADITKLVVKGLGKVEQTTIPLRIYNAKGEYKRFSVATFLGWKLDKAYKEKKPELITLGEIQEISRRKAPDTTDKNKNKAPDIKVNSITDFDKAISEAVAWSQSSNAIEAQQRLTFAQSRVKDDDATAWAYDQLLRFLRGTGIEMNATQERIKKYVDGLKAKGVDAA